MLRAVESLLPSPRVTVDAKLMARLFQSHGAMVYSRARRLLGNHEDAEEATQDIFVRVMTSRDMPAESGELVLWLSKVTTNYCLNKLRDGRRRVELFDIKVKSAANEESEGGGADRLAQARALLARADERQAQAAIYVFIDGMSHQEAADMLGVSKRTVGNLIERFTAWARDQSELPAERQPAKGGVS